MERSNTVNIEGIGPVVFIRRKRTRRLTLSLERPGTLRVTVPYRVSYKEAGRILASNTGWVKRYLARVEKAEEKHRALMEDAGDAVEIDRDAAEAKLLSRLRALSEEHGLEFNKAYIRKQKTRWGSCSSRNNISINITLAKLPDELVDYVILHELLHTKTKDHGRGFWSELDGILAGAEELDARLKDYNPSLP